MLLELVKSYLGLYCIVPLVAVVGLYFSAKLHWPQVLRLPFAFSLTFGKTRGHAGICSFSAFAGIIGSNLGTGNIAGIAVALATGGPGALFWMWVMALLGAVLKFVGCYLGVLYRQPTVNGGVVGGPMYYLTHGLKLPKVAAIYSVATLFSALTVGNLVQGNSMTLPIHTANLCPPWLAGVVLAGVIGLLLSGGVRYYAKFSARFVPVIATLYISSCLTIIWFNRTELLATWQLIFNAAFNSGAIAGGIIGFTLADAIQVGFDRGLFATDAGVGLAPIIHSQVNNPKQTLQQNALTQAMISLVAPMMAMAICMITGTVLLLSGVWQLDNLESTNACIEAFQRSFGSELAGGIVIITLCFFAITTMLTWAQCAERAIEYIADKSYIPWFRVLFVVLIPVGACCKVSLVWSLADIALNCMVLLNLIGLIGLGSRVLADLSCLRSTGAMRERLIPSDIPSSKISI